MDGNFNCHFLEVCCGAQAVSASASHEISHMRTRYSAQSPFPCFGCHGNRGSERAVARAREKLGPTQCDFAAYVNCKQATIPFTRVDLRLI